MPTPTVSFSTPKTIRFEKRGAEPRRLVRSSDGDTPVIEQPIRMVSCDTPEKAGYAGAAPVSQPKLDTCRDRLQSGFYDALSLPLREYLLEKLAVADAAERHIAAAIQASLVFDGILEERLTRPDGTRRQLAVIPAGERIDTFGRLLAYVAPWYTNSATDPLPPIGDPDRDTINLNMIANGWAAFFPIYPSLPSNADMNRAIKAAEAAWDGELGAWAANGPTFLLGYEFRACIKLATASTAATGIADAFQRICVDLRTLRIVGKHGFPSVPPPYRLWIWEEDLAQATADLGLVP
jgi:endonuclease YncB( thermonuclease family)